MIGVVPRKDEFAVVEEFFQLFKTPWEFYRAGESYDVVLVTGDTIPETEAPLVLVYGSDLKHGDEPSLPAPSGLRHNCMLRYEAEQFPLHGSLLTFRRNSEPVVCATTASEVAGIEWKEGNRRVVRIGYNLFQEVAFLLTTGQPVEHAQYPTLELHIALLRHLIVRAGIPLLEIPPAPAGYDFTVCLTHDIDFVGIRRHKFDHTMWGFLYRSTAGALLDAARRRITLAQAFKRWKAAVLLPFVHLGWAKDFWLCFDWYLDVERGLSPTYFFIPFKGRKGDRVPAANPDRRAAAYDISELGDWMTRLQNEGCEIGAHGIDAWHSTDWGREELRRIQAATGRREIGIRIHWLLRQDNTGQLLEQAGYAYDSTVGYNETPGYKCGTTQVFRPLGLKTLLELPLHIQDGALFYPGRLGLSEAEARECCAPFIARAITFGGVLTTLWHDRSPGPERFWGDFYAGLVQDLKSRNPWFATAGQAVSWFQQRRKVTFERVPSVTGRTRVKLSGLDERIEPPLRVRIHSAEASGSMASGRFVEAGDVVWPGGAGIEVDLSSRIGASAPPDVFAMSGRE